jgi:hypothetical protein
MIIICLSHPGIRSVTRNGRQPERYGETVSDNRVRFVFPRTGGIWNGTLNRAFMFHSGFDILAFCGIDGH